MKPLGILFIAIASAQPQTPAPLAFEVASVKPSSPATEHGTDGGPGTKSPELYRAGDSSLRLLICIAWNVRDCYSQIASTAPLDRTSFDIVAKVPAGVTREQFRTMLKNLLAERFALKVHVDSREFPAYEMAIAKSGSKLSDSADDASLPNSPDWPALSPNGPYLIAQNRMVDGAFVVRVKARQQNLTGLAKILSTAGDPPVVDRTGLTGRYTFALEYTKDVPGATPDALPSAPALPTALQQQLGLQLISKKLPFDVVVVESLNQMPTEN